MKLEEMSSDDPPRSVHRLDESPTFGSRAGRGLIILLVLLAAALLLTPYVLVAAAAAAQPDMLRILAEKPLTAAQLAAGLIISLLICLLPFSRMASRGPAGRPTTPNREPVLAVDTQSSRQSAGQEH